MDSNHALLNIGLSNQTKRLEILVSLLRKTSWFCVKAKMEFLVSHATYKRRQYVVAWKAVSGEKSCCHLVVFEFENSNLTELII